MQSESFFEKFLKLAAPIISFGIIVVVFARASANYSYHVQRRTMGQPKVAELSVPESREQRYAHYKHIQEQGPIDPAELYDYDQLQPRLRGGAGRNRRNGRNGRPQIPNEQTNLRPAGFGTSSNNNNNNPGVNVGPIHGNNTNNNNAGLNNAPVPLYPSEFARIQQMTITAMSLPRTPEINLGLQRYNRLLERQAQFDQQLNTLETRAVLRFQDDARFSNATAQQIRTVGDFIPEGLDSVQKDIVGTEYFLQDLIIQRLKARRNYPIAAGLAHERDQNHGAIDVYMQQHLEQYRAGAMQRLGNYQNLSNRLPRR